MRIEKFALGSGAKIRSLLRAQMALLDYPLWRRYFVAAKNLDERRFMGVKSRDAGV